MSVCVTDVQITSRNFGIHKTKGQQATQKHVTYASSATTIFIVRQLSQIRRIAPAETYSLLNAVTLATLNNISFEDKVQMMKYISAKDDYHLLCVKLPYSKFISEVFNN